MNRVLAAVVAMGLALAAYPARAEKATPYNALAKMPVKEITIFKDGHAFVLHSGRMATDTAGNVVMDYLPAPVLGTFWPYSSDQGGKLRAVTASQRKLLIERTALNLRELIEANEGAEVIVTETPASPAEKAVTPAYRATLLRVLEQSGEELEATSPPHSGERLPTKGEVVLLKTADGTKALPIGRIGDITFTGEHRTKLAHEEFRNALTLKLDWPEGKPQKEAEVGLMYVQRGIRWIPNYKVTIDGKGNAAVKLQATLVNELADLEDVTAHLVIGVPTFYFKETVDPMSLQQRMAQLSQYFQENAQTQFALSNAIMTQHARMSEVRAVPQGGGTIDLGPEVSGSEKSEDLFLFTIKHITLKKGQRMVLTVADYTVPYRDVYQLDIPLTPPPQVWQQIRNQQQAELAKLFTAPKVMHKIRLTNKSEYPFTTAPAMLVRNGKVLAQGLMTYSAIGAETDLELTTAVDVRVKKTDTETGRTPNAAVWQGDTYGRIDLKGQIELTHFGKQPVEIEVVRNVLGNVTESSDGGKVEMVNVFEDQNFAAAGGRPYWWGMYNWPWWWNHFNGVGRVVWTVKLEPGKTAQLSYTWNYYWR